jgi:hypothetical protein
VLEMDLVRDSLRTEKEKGKNQDKIIQVLYRFITDGNKTTNSIGRIEVPNNQKSIRCIK